MQPGRRVAFDIGKSRIGVAVSDPHGILASPRDFVSRAADDEKTFSDLVDIISEAGAIAVFVGLPANLKNQNTESTRDAIAIARQLAKLAEIPVRMVDERFTTKIASSAMSQAGKSTRHQRAGIDSAAAAIILETALDYERLKEEFAGTPIEEFADD
jgi:putative holliday junction resolvase